MQRLEGEPEAAERTVREALALAGTAQNPRSHAHAWRERMRVSWAQIPLPGGRPGGVASLWSRSWLWGAGLALALAFGGLLVRRARIQDTGGARRASGS